MYLNTLTDGGSVGVSIIWGIGESFSSSCDLVSSSEVKEGLGRFSYTRLQQNYAYYKTLDSTKLVNIILACNNLL